MKNTTVKIIRATLLTAFTLSAPLVLASDFCSRTPQEIIEMPYSHLNRLSFENEGGLFGGGVCWWHSRFERSANYLADFKPDQPRPSQKQAKKIIHEIMLRKRVVVIPGYANLFAFSLDYQKLIQRQLNLWQVRDALLNQAWVKGLSGKYKTTASKLEKVMDKLYSQFQNAGSQFFIKLQIKGIIAHGMNIIKMEKTTQGYRVVTTDSNYVGNSNFDKTSFFDYVRGQTQFDDVTVHSVATESNGGSFELDQVVDIYAPFIPYSEFNKLDLKRINNALKNYCNSSSLDLESND